MNPLDPYLDLEHGVLKNRLGITDPAVLAEAESALSMLRTAQLIEYPLPGAYDLAHLQAFHYHLFADVWEWAGQLRTVTMGKVVEFCRPEQIRFVGTAIFAELAATNHLRGLGRTEFVDELAHYLSAVNALHPFREGNGRTQRMFFRQLAHGAGWLLNWGLLDADRNVTTSLEARQGNTGPLREMLDELVTALD